MTAPVIVIRRDVFGGRCVVSFEPRKVDQPSVRLTNAETARRYAEERSRELGWPVDDQTETAHG